MADLATVRMSSEDLSPFKRKRAPDAGLWLPCAHKRNAKEAQSTLADGGKLCRIWCHARRASHRVFIQPRRSTSMPSAGQCHKHGRTQSYPLTLRHPARLVAAAVQQQHAVASLCTAVTSVLRVGLVGHGCHGTEQTIAKCGAVIAYSVQKALIRPILTALQIWS
jgi:hypothetical protein